MEIACRQQLAFVAFPDVAKAIRLQSSAVNSDFGSYNFSWWLPFKYPIKRPMNMQRLIGNKPFRTFVSVHPEVYCKDIAYVNQGRGAAEDRAKKEALEMVQAREKAMIAARQKKELSPEERRDFVKRSIAGAIFYGLLVK